MEKKRFGLLIGRIAGGVVVLLWLVGSVPAQEDGDVSPEASEATADTSRAKKEAAVQALEQRVQADPDDAEQWLQLGHARLDAGDLKGAEKAFEKAESRGGDEVDAKAYNGLGLVYTERPRQLQTAIHFFQKALRKAPRYVEAHYNKARAYYTHNWLSHAIKAAKDALAVDSTHVAAQQLIDRCRAIKVEDAGKSKEMYEKYLESKPEDMMSWVEWGKLAVVEGDYEQILNRLPGVIEANPGWWELFPILGQAFWKVNMLEPAGIAFSRYVEGLEEEERVLYEDLSLVTWGDETRAFEAATGEDRREVAKRFWAERDPDYTTPVNERQLEHYRRVWYARTYFSRYKQPWDRRGEVYIRYGEPDHRSRSRHPSPPLSESVTAVKERYFNLIYSNMHSLLSMGGGSEINTGAEGADYPVYDISQGEAPQNFGDLFGDEDRYQGNQGTSRGIEWYDAVTGGLTGSLVGPVFPVRSYDPNVAGGVYLPVGSSDFSMVKWESWTYTHIDGGIVIDFTDEIGKSGFDYAPIPDLHKTPGLRHGSTAGMDDIRAMTAFTRRAPMTIMRTAAAAVPEQYTIPEEDRPMDFYFDQAKFRAVADSAHVEVYYGVPMAETTYFAGDDVTGLRAACRVALAEVDKEDGRIYRSESELVYVEPGDRTGGSRFRIIPHVVALDVPPGEYTLDVRMENRLDGEIGTYRKRLTVEPYPGGPLKLSDVQLAWKVTEEGPPDRFSKNGLKVLPMPTRLYKRGQPVFLYYEIYNLRRDEFGMTNYTVEYMIRSGKPPGVISRLFRAFQGGEKDERVAVAQEQLGTQETQPSYIELDLSEVVPGEVVLTVTVEDLNSGETVSREAKFEIME